MTGKKGRKAGSRNGVYTVNRSPEEAEKLFLDNMPLVGFTIRKMEIPFTEDALQDGYIGLWKAALAFDESHDKRFSGYAVASIKGAIIRGWNNGKSGAEYELSLDCLMSERLNDAHESLKLYDILENRDSAAELEDVETGIWLGQVLDDPEQDIVKRRAAGYGFMEISQANGKKRGWAEHQLKKIAEKVKLDYERMMNLG